MLRHEERSSSPVHLALVRCPNPLPATERILMQNSQPEAHTSLLPEDSVRRKERINKRRDERLQRQIRKEAITHRYSYGTENVNDLLKQHLHDIPQIQHPTAEDEVKMYNDIKKRKQKFDSLPPDANPLLVAQYQSELNDSLNTLMEPYYKYTVSIAQKYINRGLPLMDLIQEGYVGLRRATNKFDPEKGRFTTYATWWIHQSIELAVSDSARTIRIPVDKVRAINALRKTQAQLTDELGRVPTSEEIASARNMSVEGVAELLEVDTIHTLSLNLPINNSENEEEIGDLIEDSSLPVEDIALLPNRSMDIDTVLKVLSPRERQIVLLKNNSDDYTNKEIGSIVGVSRERVRQIYAEALQTIRQSPRIELIKDYEE